MVTLSRKRRCTRVLITRRNQVAAADSARPAAAARMTPGRCSRTPFPSSINQSARRASGSAASCDRRKAAPISRGSWRYPSLHNRHIDDSAGGNGTSIRPLPRGSGEDVIRRAFFLALGEALRLQVEHRAIASVQGHQLVVGPELDDAAVLDRKSVV